MTQHKRCPSTAAMWHSGKRPKANSSHSSSVGCETKNNVTNSLLSKVALLEQVKSGFTLAQPSASNAPKLSKNLHPGCIRSDSPDEVLKIEPWRSI
jgi:hypothetical protein